MRDTLSMNLWLPPLPIFTLRPALTGRAPTKAEVQPVPHSAHCTWATCDLGICIPSGMGKKSPTGYRDMNGYGLFITVICYQYLSPVTCFVGMQKTAPECSETTQMRCWTNGLHHLQFLGRRANDDVDDWVMEPPGNTIGITVGWLLLWQVVASGSKMQGHQVRPTKL